MYGLHLYIIVQYYHDFTRYFLISGNLIFLTRLAAEREREREFKKRSSTIIHKAGNIQRKFIMNNEIKLKETKSEREAADLRFLSIRPTFGFYLESNRFHTTMVYREAHSVMDPRSMRFLCLFPYVFFEP